MTNAHNYVEPVFRPERVAIIGQGKFGARLAEEFSADGYQVHSSWNQIPSGLSGNGDRFVRHWNLALSKWADVIVFAVPIPVFAGPSGPKNIYGCVPGRGWRFKLLLDVCSTKQQSAQALEQFNGPIVIPMHPGFGPSVKPLSGQTVFVCPLSQRNEVFRRRYEVRRKWLTDFWTRRGVKLVEISPVEHDRLMSGAQFGVLLSVVLYAAGLKSAGISLNQLQNNGTPNSRAICARMARMLSAEMLETYGHLAFENGFNLEWINQAVAHLSQIQHWLRRGDRDSFVRFLRQLSEFQPPEFKTHFREMSHLADKCAANPDFIKDRISAMSPALTQTGSLSAPPQKT